MARQQFTVGLRGLLKPEVDKRAKKKAMEDIENDLDEVEKLEPEIDNTELTGDLTGGSVGAFGGAVGAERGRPSYDPEEEGEAADGGGSAAGALAGSALGNIEKVGGMMKVALGGAVAVGILGGVKKAAEASPLMQSQLEILSTAMTLFFRPFGDALARYIQPFAIGSLQMAHRFMEISDKEGLFVAVKYVAEETGESGAELATDEEAGAGRILGGLGGAAAGAKGGAAAGTALGTVLPGPGNLGGAVLGGAAGALVGGLGGAKIGGDIQEASGVEVDRDTFLGGPGNILGSSYGAVGGAATGAALGSVVPVGGTIAGGVAGGIAGGALGGIGGGKAGGAAEDAIKDAADYLVGNVEDAAWPELPSLGDLDWPELPSLGDLDWPELPSLSSLPWPELPSLGDLEWPSLPSLSDLEWPSLPSLSDLDWPELPSLRGLSWPSLPSLSSMSWPELPSLQDLEWPEFPDMNITGGQTDGEGGGILEVIGVGATGGIVDEPTVSVIGEAGPEAVVPLDRMGSPLPRRTGGGSGDGGVDLSPLEDKLDSLVREVRGSGGDVVLKVGEKELARAVDESITKHSSGTKVLK